MFRIEDVRVNLLLLLLLLLLLFLEDCVDVERLRDGVEGELPIGEEVLLLMASLLLSNVDADVAMKRLRQGDAEDGIEAATLQTNNVTPLGPDDHHLAVLVDVVAVINIVVVVENKLFFLFFCFGC